MVIPILLIVLTTLTTLAARQLLRLRLLGWTELRTRNIDALSTTLLAIHERPQPSVGKEYRHES